jgi:thiosulfate/3-mercaptopyruvate sulfurtransferase
VLTAAGVDVAAPALACCNGGVASTVVMFALHQLGNDNVTNYDGSWNEYGNRDSTSVETGSAPASSAATAAAV